MSVLYCTATMCMTMRFFGVFCLWASGCGVGKGEGSLCVGVLFFSEAFLSEENANVCSWLFAVYILCVCMIVK
jgi:hypothetical protein